MMKTWKHTGRAGFPVLRQKGFTLIEVIIVVIIVTVLFAVSLPSLRTVNDNNKLRSSLREMMTLMKYARSEAVFTGRTTEVFLDTEKHQFWLDLRKPDEKGRYDSDKKKKQIERKRNLEQNVMFEAVNALDKNIVKNKIIAVDFHPDGSASPALITLKNRRDTRYTIEVIKSTGQVEMVKADLDAVAAGQGSQSYPLPPNYNEGMALSGAVR